MCDEIARLKHRFAIRRVAGQKVKISDRDRACTLQPLHVNRSFQGRHRHAHVGRIGRDAVFAGAEDGQRAIEAVDGRAPCSRFAFVARHRRVAEVHAPSALEQVAGGRRHITKLC